MAESRLQRWSRKKTKASKMAEPGPPSTIESGPSPEEQELAVNEALPEREVLDKYALPDPDAIELGTDITGFMRKEIPELLRRKALRALWKSNPVLAVLDGLNDYDQDFTNAGVAGKSVQTLYKVGQGLIDKTARVDEQIDDQIKAQAEGSERVTPVAPSRVAERSEPEMAVESLTSTVHVEPAVTGGGPVVTEAEVALTPRYRPRMRFDN